MCISLVVQWLGIYLPMQRVQVRSLVGELRVHMPHGGGLCCWPYSPQPELCKTQINETKQNIQGTAKE